MLRQVRLPGDASVEICTAVGSQDDSSAVDKGWARLLMEMDSRPVRARVCPWQSVKGIPRGGWSTVDGRREMGNEMEASQTGAMQS